MAKVVKKRDVAPIVPLANAAGPFSLRVLATSDLHVHITPWDYYADRANVTSGLARTATLIAAARAEAGTSLLLDNGDFLNGSPMGDLMALRGLADEVHPMIAAMNVLHYDAATLGNHEFSNGLPFLLHHLGRASFPVVSANIAYRLGATPLEDQPVVPPRMILDRSLTDAQGNAAQLRIGIVGVLPPQTTQWDRQQLNGAVVTRDIVEAVTAHARKLRQEGADLIIALSHSGISPMLPSAGMEDATVAVAAIADVDVVIAGHTHQAFPSPAFAAAEGIDPKNGLLWGKPAVMPGFHGSHLGVIDLDLHRHSDGNWQVTGSRVELRPIARRTRSGRVIAQSRNATGIMSLTKAAHRATRDWAAAPLGRIETPLHSYFALVQPSAAIRVIARAQADYVMRRLQGGPYADLPVLSATAPFHAGGRGGPDNYTAIAAGDLVMRHAADLYPHPNTIAAVLVTGADLAQWLERSFSIHHQIRRGAVEALLINPLFPSFNFDLIEGLDWTVDLTVPPQFNSHGTRIGDGPARIQALTYRGQPVDPRASFVLATNSYRAAGSGGFSGATPDRIILVDPESSRGVLRHYITATGTIARADPPNWRFAPLGASVVFDSAPAAADFLDDLSPMAGTALQTTPEGFRRFRLRL
ncbi:MAG: bifunctional 2',3'-cyclic-nucleotide 2'-phosphodiesterase/3'-nucleotidase [bacterium]